MLLEKFTHKLKQEVCNEINNAYSDLENVLPDVIHFTKPPSPDMGDYAIPCFPFARSLKKAPVAIAQEIANAFSPTDLIEKLQAVGPYVNIFINKTQFSKIVCSTVSVQKSDFGRGEKKQKQIMIEYSSPNTNKPLHLGHLRNNILGMAVANILEFYGYDVTKVNLVNDRGIHICKSMLAYQKWGNEDTPEKSGIKGDHFVGKYYVLFDQKLKEEKELYSKKHNIDTDAFSSSVCKNLKQQVSACKDPKEKKEMRQRLKGLEKNASAFNDEFLLNSKLYSEAQSMLQKWEKEDEDTRALWKMMNAWVMAGFHETYAILGCEFDTYYFESETFSLGKQYVQEGATKGTFIKKEDNSIWVKGESLKKGNPEGFKKFSPKDKLLLRADGTSVYITQDIGTTIMKNKDSSLDQCLFVVGEEQGLHFKTLFTILDILGFSWAKKCRHISYGMVTLPEGKLKSREGTSVDADDLVAEMQQRVIKKIRTNEKINVSEEKVEQTAKDIALAALKLFLLNISREKSLLFDPNKAISGEESNEEATGQSNAIAFSGDTGPYIQYGYARIFGIFRKANIEITSDVDYSLLSSLQEQTLLHKVADFPNAIASAAENDSPHVISGYLLELTKLLFKFYGAHKVIDTEEETKKARLLLCKTVAQVIKNGMNLLGINVPERM